MVSGEILQGVANKVRRAEAGTGALSPIHSNAQSPKGTLGRSVQLVSCNVAKPWHKLLLYYKPIPSDLPVGGRN